ncbi:MAG TPA: DUF6508 domain-containing protein [Flavisolibacter sp.]|nr:DUF6508 domain-containing protein [Flavisolibacter sp.]
MKQQQLSGLRQFIHRFETEKPIYTFHTEATLTPYIYGSAITDFVQYMYNEKLVPANYMDIADRWNEAKDREQFIAALNEEECLQLLGGFIRGDRFCDGLLAC